MLLGMMILCTVINGAKIDVQDIESCKKKADSDLNLPKKSNFTFFENPILNRMAQGSLGGLVYAGLRGTQSCIATNSKLCKDILFRRASVTSLVSLFDATAGTIYSILPAHISAGAVGGLFYYLARG